MGAAALAGQERRLSHRVGFPIAAPGAAQYTPRQGIQSDAGLQSRLSL
jgi:hypothetical protein